jgi:hypothetical protein
MMSLGIDGSRTAWIEADLSRADPCDDFDTGMGIGGPRKIVCAGTLTVGKIGGG